MDQQNGRGPYRPETQSLGGTPSIIPDVPISVALMVLFIVAGAAHQTIFIINKKRGRFFGVSGMVFGLCNIRLFTFSLRIAWAALPTNISLGLASTLFVYAGSILLFLANLVFTQRIIRAQHLAFGWSKFFNVLFPAIFASIIISLIMVIVAVVHSFFTLDPNARRIDRDIQLYSLTFFAFIAFLPVLMVLISTGMGQVLSIKLARKWKPIDKFGQGRMVHKVWIVVISGLLNTAGAGFRAGANWMPTSPAIIPDSTPPALASPPWYFSKACFYAINFGLELIVVFLWLLVRVDRQFWIPNKCKGTYNPHSEEERKEDTTPVIPGPEEMQATLDADIFSGNISRRMSGETQIDAREQELIRTTNYGEDLLKSFSQIDIQMDALSSKLDLAMDAMSARTLSDNRSSRTFAPDADGRSMRSLHHDSWTLQRLDETEPVPTFPSAHIVDRGSQVPEVSTSQTINQARNGLSPRDSLNGRGPSRTSGTRTPRSNRSSIRVAVRDNAM